MSQKKDKNKLCLYRIYKFVFGEISKRKTGENDPKKKSGKRIELSTCNDPTGGRRKQKEDKGYSDFRSRDDDDLILFWDQKPIRWVIFI